MGVEREVRGSRLRVSASRKSVGSGAEVLEDGSECIWAAGSLWWLSWYRVIWWRAPAVVEASKDGSGLALETRLG